VNINLNLSNPTVTSNGVDKFLEFDIMAFASQAGTYLDNGVFHLDYNTAVFGSNIFQNNKVVITQGPTFPSPNYTIGANDNDPTSIKGIRDGLLKTFRGNVEGLSEYGFKIKVTTSNRKAVAKKAPNT